MRWKTTNLVKKIIVAGDNLNDNSAPPFVRHITTTKVKSTPKYILKSAFKSSSQAQLIIIKDLTKKKKKGFC